MVSQKRNEGVSFLRLRYPFVKRNQKEAPCWVSTLRHANYLNPATTLNQKAIIIWQHPRMLGQYHQFLRAVSGSRRLFGLRIPRVLGGGPPFPSLRFAPRRRAPFGGKPWEALRSSRLRGLRQESKSLGGGAWEPKFMGAGGAQTSSEALGEGTNMAVAPKTGILKWSPGK